MPKPRLIPEQEILQREVIACLIAGLKQYRPDLHYPESHSDMSACVMNLMEMFDISRRSEPKPLEMNCHGCDGLGILITVCSDNGGYRESKTCPVCKGHRVRQI